MIKKILVFLLIAQTGWSAERYEFFTGVRQMGMGGVAVPTVNDETALLSNPAALGKLRNMFFTVFDPEITAGIKDTSILGTSSVANMTTMQGLLDATALKPDEHWNSKVQLFPSFVLPNFGVGVFAKSEYNAEVDSTSNKFEVDYVNDYALILGYSLRIWDGRIKIGVSGKVLNRVQVNESLDPASTGLDWGTYAKEGGAIGGDAGLILTAPWSFLPTLAATVHDVGHTTFDQGNGYFYKPGANRRPDVIQQSVDVGFGVFPIHANRVRSSIAVEYRDVLKTPEATDDPMKRVHVGTEVNFGDVFFLRAGMNQRYWTAGMELSMPYIQFQFASYGEEIGTKETNQEDRRYIAKFAFRL